MRVFRVNLATIQELVLAFIIIASFTGVIALPANANYLFSTSANQLYEHSAYGQGVRVRGAYALSPIGSVGFSLSGTLVQEDSRKFFAMSLNGSASYRRKIPYPLPLGIKPFFGGLAGIGSWTACVGKEQCGGFGPSLGGEIGFIKEIPLSLKSITYFRFDWQSGLFGPHDPIYIYSLATGIEY